MNVYREDNFGNRRQISIHRSSIFNSTLSAGLWLARSKDVLVLNLLSVFNRLLSHLFCAVLLGYCRLFGSYGFAITRLWGNYIVLEVVVTDFDGPLMPPPKLLELKEEEVKPLPLKKSSLLPKKELPPKPPKLLKPPKPPEDFPPFLRLKKLLKKSSSSWSKPLVEKNLAKMSSASLKLKWLKEAALGPSKPYVS
jgi:hypothetical protein